LGAIERSPKDSRALIFRSLSFYRRALQLRDPLEAFVLLFFAFEALNVPLAHFLAVATEHVARNSLRTSA